MSVTILVFAADFVHLHSPMCSLHFGEVAYWRPGEVGSFHDLSFARLLIRVQENYLMVPNATPLDYSLEMF